MDNNVQKEEGISLMDIMRLLLSKIKLLILLVIIGGFIGGAFSVWKTKDVKYYGSQIRFYVNPESPTMSADGSGMNTGGSEYGVYGAYGEHIMDNMVKLLNEDAFAEEMLLRWQDTSAIVDDESTPFNERDIYKYLPVKDFWTSKTETKLTTDLNTAIDNAIEPVKEIIAAENAEKQAQKDYIAAVAAYLEATNILKEKWNDAFGISHGEYSELKFSNLTAEDKQNLKFGAVNDAFGIEREKSKEMSNAQIKLTSAKDEIKLRKQDALPFRNEVIDLWAKTAKYKSMHAKFSAATHFSFLLASEDREDANKFARSFIYANISVYGDANREFGDEVYDIVKALVPEYVSANMWVPDKYTGTNCQRISRNDNVRQTNVGFTRSQAIKSAFLMAVAVGVIACVVIIIVDRSDKRLRDCDVIAREFHVPILGIVPTIDMDNLSTTKKTTANKQNKEEK